MSVLKRGNSKNWYIQFQFKGKTYIRSSRTTDKRLAEQMEREWKRQLHTQEFLGQKERIRITDILDQFIESKKGTPNHRNLEIHKKVLLRLFNTNRYLNEITSQDLERLKRDREQDHASPATIKHTFSLIRGMSLTLTEIDPPMLTKTDPPGPVLTQSDPVDKDAVVRFHCGPRCSTARRVLARANGEWMGRPEAALRERGVA